MVYVMGGRADKFSNRYEGRCIIEQYLQLLDEEIKGVAIEAIGNNESGIDLRIINKKGQRQALQCKARNGNKESWSTGDLNSREIFKKAKFQLDRNPVDFYFLVSAVPVINMNDICIDARNSCSRCRVGH